MQQPFELILEKYRRDFFSEREKGYRFERLMQNFLKFGRYYEGAFEEVWLWNEFPYNQQFGGKRKGWWQKGTIYKHRKDYIDSLFGNLKCNEYVDIVKLSIAETLGGSVREEIMKTIKTSPIIRSNFKQMQETGKEAEYYFMNNYQTIETFTKATIADARLFGDGYDFQLTFTDKYFLVEVKGLKQINGNIRMTQKEYEKAIEYKTDYVLV